MTATLRELSCADDYDPNAMPVDKARDFISKVLTPITTTERVHIRAALGRVLAEDIISPLDVPGHENSAMDGWAYRHTDTLSYVHPESVASAGGTTTMKRIGTVKQTLAGLAKVFGEDVLTAEVMRLLGRGMTRKQPGFTRACRVVLMEAGIPLEARQGFREMRRRFPELVERHKDPVASVTTVFNRLVGYAEVRSFRNNKGRRVWQWVTESVDDADAAILPVIEVGQGPQSAATVS